MRRFIGYILLALFIGVVSSCSKEAVDNEKPLISFSFDDAAPRPCDTARLGDTLLVSVRFTDNVELGSFRIDIHHNFDHHSHSTEAVSCQHDPKKPAVNPYVFVGVYEIPSGKQSYDAKVKIQLPQQNSSGLLQPGDYHFFISLTDATGWSSNKGFGIKLLLP